MIKIKPLGPTRFQTVGVLGAVIVDFAPIIKAYGLSGNFVLGHWNRMICKPAFYNSSTQSYHTADEDEIMVKVPMLWAGIPKLKNPGVLPTSCNLHPNATLRVEDGYLIIEEIKDEPDKLGRPEAENF